MSGTRSRRRREAGEGLPRVLGADVELGNLLLGSTDARQSACRRAAHALLAQIDGVAARRRAAYPYAHPYAHPYAYSYAAAAHTYGGGNGGSWPGPATGEGGPAWSATAPWDLDWGRKFLRGNGGCVYIDLDHLELAIPEVRSASDFVAACHAMLRIARAALHAANAQLPAGQRIVALANNSDGKGHSYGSHLNVCMERRAWRQMLERRMHPALFFLAAFQVSSIVITGSGKTGSESGPAVPYQISARADFFEQIVGIETSQHRPLVNTRDESHCVALARRGRSRAPELARLHCIFFDHTLCHVATYLKAGLMQLIVAMIEAGRVDRRLMLRYPLEALHHWSRDPGLHARARLVDGRSVTAVELQRLFLELARRFVDSGECGERVPEAGAILRLWEDTLDRLASRDFIALARRLDWVRKRSLLERAMSGSRLDWLSPDIAYLDQMYASLDEDEGLYWACERDAAVDRLVASEQIDHFVHEPPHDTRAWTRSMLLRSFAPDDIEAVDWSFVKVRLSSWPRGEEPLTVWMHTPHQGTRADHPIYRAVGAHPGKHPRQEGEHAGT